MTDVNEKEADGSCEPISPKDVGELKAKNLPKGLIKKVNNLIAEKWNGVYAAINVPKSKMFNGYEKYCTEDIRTVYSLKGWKIEIDRPGYNESGDTIIKFSKKD